MKRAFLWLLLAVLILLMLLPVLRREEVISTGAWGLSFQTEGQPPVGNADREELKKYDAAYLGNTEEKVIYLTFDSGYENGCTEKILDVLQKHDVKATFFLVGNYVEQNPILVKRMLAEGHTVGNHTYHHYNMSKISDAASFQRELESLEKLYFEVTGERMSKYYRPPQGIYSEENLRMAKEMGYVDWNNDAQPTSEEAFSKLIPRIHNGAVVLLHSTSKTNGEILDDLLSRGEEMGYHFGSMEELFAQSA